jgi:hypothetical protein
VHALQEGGRLQTEKARAVLQMPFLRTPIQAESEMIQAPNRKLTPVDPT